MEIQQTPVRTAIMRIMSDMLDNPDKDGIYETGRFMDRIEQLLCDMMVAPDVMQLSGSEAVFGLMAWLTTRKETTVIGPHQVVDIDIIERFIKTNGLKEPREAWHELLIHPPELDVATKTVETETVGVEKVDSDKLDFVLEAGVDVEIIDIFEFEDPTALDEASAEDSKKGEEPVVDFQIQGSLEEVLGFIIRTGIHKRTKAS